MQKLHAGEASGRGILMLYSGVKSMLCFYNWLEAQIPISVYFWNAVSEMFGTVNHAYRN